ncbi:MAG: hypothetical protein ACR2IE_16920 [Candidatus Sumerlaeaceae bacterium]
MKLEFVLAAGLLVVAPLQVSSQTTSTVHNGQYALRLNRTTFSVDSVLDREAPGTRVPVAAGDGLILSFWARNGQVSTSFINRVAVAFFTSGGTYIPPDINFNVSASVPTVWTQFTEPVTTAPATAATMNVAFRLDGNSSIVLDDISVINTSTSNTQILTNPGFETWPDPAVIPTGWRFFGSADGNFERLVAPAQTAARDSMMYE